MQDEMGWRHEREPFQDHPLLARWEEREERSVSLSQRSLRQNFPKKSLWEMWERKDFGEILYLPKSYEEKKPSFIIKGSVCR